MKKNRGQGGDAGGNWMDTYGDMVTLLLTFFVMLYSMSSINEQKWEMFVRSISPEQAEVIDENNKEDITVNVPVQINDNKDNNSVEAGNPDTEKNAIADISTLYLKLAENLDAQGIEGVSISRGSDYTFILFRDKTFFKGDSSKLTSQGQKTLDVFCNTLKSASSQISQINIMGHTAQELPDKKNVIRVDRMLSSMRATEAGIYIQNKNVVPDHTIVTLGYGQFRPIALNDKEENRKLNRRVEILILDNDAEIKDLDKYYDEIRNNQDVNIETDGKEKDASHYKQIEEEQKEKIKNESIDKEKEAASTATNIPKDIKNGEEK